MSSPVPVNEGPKLPHSGIQPRTAVEVFYPPAPALEELQPPSSDDVQPRGTRES